MVCDCVVPNAKPAPGNGFIYLYTMDDGKQYVGQTVMDIRYRHACHKGGNQLIDRFIRKHRWSLKIIGEYPEAQLDDMEKHFIAYYDTMKPNGLNIEEGGNLNKHLSEETKQKDSETHKGKTPWMKGKHHTDESKKVMSLSQKNRFKNEDVWCKGLKLGPLSEEHKKKISESNKGRKLTVETRKKISDAHRGMHHTEETRQKLRDISKKGIPLPEETKLKMSLSLKGRKPSSEHRKHLSEAQLRYHAIRKFFMEVMI